jgi:adenine-specific DNA methylase
MLDYSKSFIETQFPVSKISKESYNERQASQGQTLTGLGKWWGRKPLILVRATLLGTLMPVSDDPAKDKDIFLKILTMDEEGLWSRKTKNIPVKDLVQILSKAEVQKYFTDDLSKFKNKEDKEIVQKLAFNRLSYDDKLKFCDRPEQYELTNIDVWNEINGHLETTATSIQELIEQLGIKRFGYRPKVGDAFAGGGSIPFESARIGADVYASDLNPIATMLNWASINIVGANEQVHIAINNYQKQVYESVDNQVKSWGIEHNEKGHRADSYLYCNETICPECGYTVPLAPSWIIGKGTKTIANLVDNGNKGFDFEIKMNASKSEFQDAEKNATIRKGNMFCPHCKQETPITSIRGDSNNSSGLRAWEKNDFLPRDNDTFKERLYAIRYVDGKDRYYTEPSRDDIERELKVEKLLSERFVEWQDMGYIPSLKIESGYNTDQPMRERGWQYWHQLFNPRQLLIHGLFSKTILETASSTYEYVIGALGLNKMNDWSSKLCIWNTGAGTAEKSQNTFSNQSLNTLFSYGMRGMIALENSWFISPKKYEINSKSDIEPKDARNIDKEMNIWITDPPYADAVNYEQLTEYFLSWDKPIIEKAFPNWHTDSKRILAVKGIGQTFNESMISVYTNLAKNMSDNGYQVVMFTHQDVKVWSELSMILWSAGLKVVSAWNIATETTSGLKAGNYVKGTVLLTLKKQTSDEIAFQDELYDEIKYEVKHIIDSMKALDDKDDPDFTDADYLLASYASSLKVLTAYKEIDGIDVEYWLSQPRDSKEENPIEALINKAVRIAYDYLIPEGFDTSLWKDLKPEERFYVRGLEVEMSGVAKISSYQELARGFGVSDYTDMFANFKANSARLKTPSEYRMAFLNGDGFTSTLLRHLLVAIYETTENKSTVEGRAYLKGVYQKDNQYWYKKPLMVELLSFIANLEYVDHMKHWHEHAYSAKILKEALKNEGV